MGNICQSQQQENDKNTLKISLFKENSPSKKMKTYNNIVDCYQFPALGSCLCDWNQPPLFILQKVLSYIPQSHFSYLLSRVMPSFPLPICDHIAGYSDIQLSIFGSYLSSSLCPNLDIELCSIISDYFGVMDLSWLGTAFSLSWPIVPTNVCDSIALFTGDQCGNFTKLFYLSIDENRMVDITDKMIDSESTQEDTPQIQPLSQSGWITSSILPTISLNLCEIIGSYLQDFVITSPGIPSLTSIGNHSIPLNVCDIIGEYLMYFFRFPDYSLSLLLPSLPHDSIYLIAQYSEHRFLNPLSYFIYTTITCLSPSLSNIISMYLSPSEKRSRIKTLLGNKQKKNIYTLSSPITSKITVDVYTNYTIAGSALMQGLRMYMEDEIVINVELEHHPHTSIYAVLDGHTGNQASRFCAYQLPLIIDSLINPFDPIAIKKAVLNLDKKLKTYLIENNIQDKDPGTTCVFVIIKPFSFAETKHYFKKFGNINSLNDRHNRFYHLLVANVGDSRLILFNKEGKIRFYTEDHKPDLPEEKDRILSAGGKVKEVAGLARVDGIIAVSRSLGDHHYKTTRSLPPEKQRVCALPEVQLLTAKSSDIIFIASDGIYDELTNQFLSTFVSRGVNSRLFTSISHIAQKIVDTSLHYGSTDNMSAIIVKLLPYDFQTENCNSTGNWDFVTTRPSSNSIAMSNIKTDFSNTRRRQNSSFIPPLSKTLSRSFTNLSLNIKHRLHRSLSMISSRFTESECLYPIINFDHIANFVPGKYINDCDKRSFDSIFESTFLGFAEYTNECGFNETPTTMIYNALLQDLTWALDTITLISEFYMDYGDQILSLSNEHLQPNSSKVDISTLRLLQTILSENKLPSNSIITNSRKNEYHHKIFCNAIADVTFAWNYTKQLFLTCYNISLVTYRRFGLSL